MLNILWRNMKWRLQNPFSIVVSVLQPLLWLIMYSTVAGQTMRNSGIENYTSFMLPGIMILVTFSSCSSSGMMNYSTKKNGSFYRILISPTKRSSIILGQGLEPILLAAIEILILCIVSAFMSVRLQLSPAVFLTGLLLLFLTAFFIANLSYSISLLLPNEVVYETVMNSIVLPVFFMSTALVPEQELQGVLKSIVNMNPFTHVINTLRDVLITGEVCFAEVSRVAVLMLVLCTAAFLLAWYSLKRETVS